MTQGPITSFKTIKAQMAEERGKVKESLIDVEMKDEIEK
jgi:hypothetical protein